MLRTHIAAGVLTLAAGTVAVAALQPTLFQDMPTPGKFHEMLQSSVGSYEGTVTMMAPGMPADPMPATETVEALGPFWTITEFKSDFMGQPFTGKGATGYDPEKKMFVGTWIDSMTPSLSIMEGEYDEEKKAIIMRWKAPNMTGEIVDHRSVTVHTEDGYTMEFFEGDSETKNMEIKMTRAKAGAVEAGADK